VARSEHALGPSPRGSLTARQNGTYVLVALDAPNAGSARGSTAG